MSDTLIVLHTAIAIVAIVLLILIVRIDPVISLVTSWSQVDSSLYSPFPLFESPLVRAH
jgi:hypothetical protein